jgi:hypothetical protein
MGGNRKFGFLRGNRGGFRPRPWKCHGCNRMHPGRTMRTQALNGLDYCERTYYAARDEINRARDYSDKAPEGIAVY